ncbi:MAG TPA: glycosyltransferase family 61 protein, partial [Solirubrobacterales bacterium]|nr:glycosyltransferase family 61 protein [Solirubrobacterales bacterium]
GYFPAWEDQAIRLAELLGRSRLSSAERAAVAGHVDEGLWHHREAQHSSAEPVLPPEVAGLYALLKEACGPHSERTEADLDAEARRARTQREGATGQARAQDREVPPLPMVRALKHYPPGETRAGRLRPRDDLTIHPVAGRTTVTLPEPLEGDGLTKPMSYSAGPLAMTELRNGAVLRDGGFVFTAENELLRESVDRRAFADRLAKSHPNLQGELEAAKPEEPCETVAVLGGQRAVNYFHWWIDVVAKCWMLEGWPHRACRLTTSPLTHEFQRESLRLLGLEAQTLTRPVQRFHRLVFAHGLAPGSAQTLAPQVTEFGRWCRARLNRTASRGERKLFLSRRRARTRRLVNEDEVLAALGPEIERVELESLPVREIADLFAEACLVVAPHGAGLTNLLFCPEPTPVVELVPESSPPATYRQLAGLLGHPYLAVPCKPYGENLAERRPVNRDMRAPAERVATLARRLSMTPSQA